MRLILLILLLCSFGADAQMIIKAHANYRPYAQPAANFLLDDYPNAAAAYSLRKLRTAYTGACIRVRRSSDNVENDIGFDANGNLDENQLTTFTGSASGFVTIWYDQSGNGRNAPQVAAGSQPRIVLNGIIERKNTKPSINFISTGVFEYGAITELHKAGNTAFFLVASDNNPFDASNSGYFGNFRWGRSETGIVVHSLLSNGSLSIEVKQPGLVVLNTTSANAISSGVTFLLSSINDFGNATAANRNYLYINNTLYQNNTQTATPSTGPPSRTTLIGGFFGTSPLNGNISEFVIYYIDQSSNRVGIQSNINTYYSIY